MSITAVNLIQSPGARVGRFAHRTTLEHTWISSSIASSGVISAPLAHNSLKGHPVAEQTQALPNMWLEWWLVGNLLAIVTILSCFPTKEAFIGFVMRQWKFGQLVLRILCAMLPKAPFCGTYRCLLFKAGILRQRDYGPRGYCNAGLGTLLITRLCSASLLLQLCMFRLSAMPASSVLLPRSSTMSDLFV